MTDTKPDRMSDERITDEMLDVYRKRWGDSCSDAGNLSKYLKAERQHSRELEAQNERYEHVDLFARRMMDFAENEHDQQAELLDALEGLPEKWRELSYKTTDAYTNLHGCADELEALLGKESEDEG